MREDFTGYLICSDYDGTFSHGGAVPARNIAAAEEYMRRGGLFTYCTGRSWDAAAQGYPLMPNAPMVALCGGQIGDVAAGRMLEGYPMDGRLLADLRALAGEYPVERVELCFETHSVTAPPRELPEAADEPIFKVVLFTREQTVSRQDDMRALCGGRYNISFNGPYAAELTCAGHDKGAGALRVKQLTGAKTLVGIGDFEADRPLLAAADIAAAPTGTRMEECAVLVTASAQDGAIADLIERL